MSRDDEHEINFADLKSYETWLRSLAWRILGNSDDVDEVVQDVWLANLRQNGPRHPSRAWLGAVTRNLSMTRIRRKMLRVDVEKKAARVEELDDNVQTALERVSLYRELLQWILDMKEPYRETLLLRYARNLKLREVARLMDVPESTARVRLQRGHALLQEKAHAQYSQERRHQLIWILLAPGLNEPSRSVAKTLILGLSLIIGMTLVAVFLRGHFIETPEVILATAQSQPSTASNRPQRSSAPVPEASVSAEIETSGHPGPTLRGRIEFLRDGLLYPGDLRIEAIPFMVGRVMELPALRPDLPPLFETFDSPFQTTVANGTAYAIPVAEPGRYRLMIAVSGVQGVLQFWSGTDHWTNAPQTPASTFELIDGIEIHHEARDFGRYAIKWRSKHGGVDQDLDFKGGVAKIDGLFMPRLHCQWTDTRNGQVWSREINEPVTTLAMPELVSAGPFEMRQDGSDDRPREPQLSLLYCGADHVLWQSTLRVADVLHPQLFVPSATTAATIFLSASAAACLPLSVDLSREQIPEVLALQRHQTLAGQVVGQFDALKPPLTIVAMNGEVPFMAGESQPNGTFTLHPLGPADATALAIEGRKLSFWIFGDGACFGHTLGRVRNHQVSLELPRAKSFKIRIRNQQSLPIEGAVLVVLPWDEKPISPLLYGRRIIGSRHGEAEFGNIQGGQWLVDVQAPGFASKAIVIDWNQDSESAIEVTLEPNVPIQCHFQVTDPDGKPLPYAFVAIAGAAKRHASTWQTDQFGEAIIDVADFEGLAFDVTYPSLAISIAAPLLALPGIATNLVTMKEIVPIRCQVRSTSTAPIWLRVSGKLPTLGRQRLIRFKSGDLISVTAEAQRLEFFQLGHLPKILQLQEPPDQLIVSLSPGPKLTLLDCQSGDQISLQPELLSDDFSPSPAMTTDFQLHRTATESTLEWPMIVPGSYQLEVVRADRVEPIRRQIVITTDHQVSLRD